MADAPDSKPGDLKGFVGPNPTISAFPAGRYNLYGKRGHMNRPANTDKCSSCHHDFGDHYVTFDNKKNGCSHYYDS